MPHPSSRTTKSTTPVGGSGGWALIHGVGMLLRVLGCPDRTRMSGWLLVDSVQHWLSTSPPPCSRQTCRSSSASR